MQTSSDSTIEIVNAILENHRRRKFHKKTQIMSANRLSAYIRSYIIDAPISDDEVEREKLLGRARRIITGVLKPEKMHKDDAAYCAEASVIVQEAQAGMIYVDHSIEGLERELKSLAEELPVYEFAAKVLGLGELGLAQFVGECGDFAKYRTVSCVWKRLGLAVINGQRQRRVKNADEAIEMGYNPQRRAISWNIAQSLFKAQWRGEKDVDGRITPAHAIGPYGSLYAFKKAQYLERVASSIDLPAKIGVKMNPAKWTPKRADNAARRYMEKALVKDLYIAWLEAEGLQVPQSYDEMTQEVDWIENRIA